MYFYAIFISAKALSRYYDVLFRLWGQSPRDDERWFTSLRAKRLTNVGQQYIHTYIWHRYIATNYPIYIKLISCFHFVIKNKCTLAILKIYQLVLEHPIARTDASRARHELDKFGWIAYSALQRSSSTCNIGTLSTATMVNIHQSLDNCMSEGL